MTSGAVDSGQYVSISPRSLSVGDSRARDVKASSDIWHKMHPSGRFTIPISTDSACWPRQREIGKVYVKARDEWTGKRAREMKHVIEGQSTIQWKRNLKILRKNGRRIFCILEGACEKSECAESIGWTEKSRMIMKNGWWIFLKEWMKEWRNWWKLN